jgi:hypothetical protein
MQKMLLKMQAPVLVEQRNQSAKCGHCNEGEYEPTIQRTWLFAKADTLQPLDAKYAKLNHENHLLQVESN